jgi:alpha-mannosidase II
VFCRSAEILFTLAQAYARKHTASNFPSVSLMQRLVTARRSLGLFQHHDGITGTAKDFVVNDYGTRSVMRSTRHPHPKEKKKHTHVQK